ncbi:hypothetical protein C0431_08970 [bacterium]|nr:hypothetical protein [bacterium]
MRIGRVVLFVDDVAGLAEFYQRCFGMEIVSKEKGWIELDGRGCNLGLHAAKGADGEGSNAKICWLTGDVLGEKERLEDLGVKFVREFEWEGMRFADFVDPAGNVVQITDRGA